jgi:hypothetical protein
MGTITSDLKKIDGISNVLADRLKQEGIKTYRDVAKANPEALESIKGMDDLDIAAIQEQARILVAEEKQNHELQLKALLDNTDRLKSDIKNLVEHLRDATQQNPSNRSTKALRKEISRIMAALEQVETTLFSQMQRLGKGLAKADEKLAAVKNGTQEEITEGLKKARKKLDQALD